MSAGLVLRRIDLLFRGSKRYFYPLGRKVCLVTSTFIAQWTKICAMTPANATTKVFSMRKTKPAPFFASALDLLQEPGQVLTEILHILHALLIGLDFAFFTAKGVIPIGRSHGDHLIDLTQAKNRIVCALRAFRLFRDQALPSTAANIAMRMYIPLRICRK